MVAVADVVPDIDTVVADEGGGSEVVAVVIDTFVPACCYPDDLVVV